MNSDNAERTPKKKVIVIRTTPFEHGRLGSRKIEKSSGDIKKLKTVRKIPKDKMNEGKGLKEIASKTANLWQKARQGFSLGKFTKLNKTINKRRYGIDIDDKGSHIEKGSFVIHPNNFLYTGFTYILAVIILYAVTILPYELSLIHI
eukprot:TRINITY_DN7498_c0_g1_i3.p1 TRINITY_DN7498_c0_g1~~TRINITY_DN7498_c0_g1_i3.p1  ORF type:complete len:147 (-),score=18.35 TRINITY_DN7498_c0_g1_i3:60-500(-)